MTLRPLGSREPRISPEVSKERDSSNAWEAFSPIQLLSHVRLFATPWTAARQASLSNTNSQSLLKLISIELVMPSNHLTLCCPLRGAFNLIPPIQPLPPTPYAPPLDLFSDQDREAGNRGQLVPFCIRRRCPSNLNFLVTVIILGCWAPPSGSNRRKDKLVMLFSVTHPPPTSCPQLPWPSPPISLFLKWFILPTMTRPFAP